MPLPPRNKKLLGAPGLTTRSKDATSIPSHPDPEPTRMLDVLDIFPRLLGGSGVRQGASESLAFDQDGASRVVCHSR